MSSRSRLDIDYVLPILDIGDLLRLLYVLYNY